MKRTLTTLAALGLAAGLAACGRQEAAQAPAPAEATNTAAAPAAPAASNMAGMDMSAGAKMAKGEGVVTAVDATAGAITVNHGPIAEAGWPAMTMGFKAAPEIAGQVKPGDKVAFDLKLEGGAGEITAIAKR